MEWDCVRMSDDPVAYDRDTKMILKSGNCGFMYQITNKNQEFQFNFQYQHDPEPASAFQALSVAVTAIVALALF